MLLLNNIPVMIHQFNGGEIQVSIENISIASLVKHANVTANIKCSSDIIALLQLKTIIDEYSPKTTKLILPRMPYAQSDRAMTPYECSGLKIFAQLLNSCNFDSIEVHDPHSDVTEALVNNLHIIPQHECLVQVPGFKANTYDFLISPDGGALKKIYKSSKVLNVPVIEASKQRDVATGALSGTKIQATVDELEGKRVLILDDLADGGGTFIPLASKLKEELGVKQVDLYVTHGLFSRGFNLANIDNIFAYNLWEKPSIPSNVFYKNIF